MRSVPAIDATGIHAFEAILKTFEKKGKTLIISHANEQPLKAFKKSGLYSRIGKENFQRNIDDALKRASEILKNE
jgi:SulP family sulfate permease